MYRIIPREGVNYGNEAYRLSGKLGYEKGLMNSDLVVGMNLNYLGVYDSAQVITERGIAAAKRLGDKAAEAFGHNSMGNILLGKGDFFKAMTHVDMSYGFFSELHDTVGMVKALNNKGNQYLAQGKDAQALKAFLLCLKLSESQKNKLGISIAHANIGGIYRILKDSTLALQHFKHALNYFVESGNIGSSAWIYNNMGIVYSNSKRYDESLKMYYKSLEYRLKIGDKHDIANSYSNISGAYYFIDSLEQAIAYSKKAMELQSEIDDAEGLSISCNLLGNIYTKKKDFSQAKRYYVQGINVLKGKDFDYVLSDAYYLLSKVDSALGDYTSAYKHYRLHIALRDTLQSKENTKKMVEAQMNYDFEKKEAVTKAEFDNEKKLADAATKRQRIISIFVSSGLILVLIFAVFIFRSLRITRNQKKVIESQKAIVEEHRKDMIDSITYAKRLQEAILPPLELVQKHLPDTFILYKPKDIVAGDFYWMETVGDTVLFAAADCTGHGVPGAMVSVVCSNALNRAVKEFGLREPGGILDKVTDLVMETFERSEKDVKDGMDISLIKYDKKSRTLQWSGANNSLWYVQEGELFELDPDKQPIGKFDNRKPFTTHSLSVLPGTYFYLFTDGYADQFGGPRGKKFKYKPMKELILKVHQYPPDQQKQSLDAAILAWKGELEQVDDICVIGVKL